MSKIFKSLFKLSNIQLLLLIMLLSIAIRTYSEYSYIHEMYKIKTVVWVDDWDYINYSKAIFNGIFLHTQFITQESEYYRIDEIPPLYPMILSIFYGIVGYSHLHWIFLLNIFVTLINIYLLYLIASFLYKGKLTLLPAFLWSIYINSLIHTARVLKEPFITLFILLIVYMLCRLLLKFKYRDVGILAMLCAMFSHLDERYLFMSALSLLFVIVILIKQKSKSYIGKAVFLYILISLVLYTPWMIRNYLRYDKIVLITLRTSIITDKIFGYDNSENAIVDLTTNVTAEKVDSIIAGHTLSTVDIVTQKNIVHAGKLGIKPYHYNLTERLLYNTMSFWQLFSLRPFMIGSGYKVNFYWGIKSNIIVIFEFSIFFILSLYAFYQGIRKRQSILIFMFCILLLNTMQHAYLGAGLTRYRSVMDPLIYLAAGYTIYQFISRKQLRKTD